MRSLLRSASGGASPHAEPCQEYLVQPLAEVGLTPRGAIRSLIATSIGEAHGERGFAEALAHRNSARPEGNLERRLLMFLSPRRLALSDVVTAGEGLPNRCVLHGVEGIGKTSFGACAPKPIVLMTRGETGLITLLDSGQLPPTPHFPELLTWEEL